LCSPGHFVADPYPSFHFDADPDLPYPRLYFESPSLQYESLGPPLLPFEPPQLLKVDVDADSNSDPAFDFDADPGPLFHSDADPDPKL
jgi:hypothetical protein